MPFYESISRNTNMFPSYFPCMILDIFINTLPFFQYYLLKNFENRFLYGKAFNILHLFRQLNPIT